MKILSILEQLFVKILISLILYICTYTAITIAEGDIVAKVYSMQDDEHIYSVIDKQNNETILYKFKIKVDENAIRGYKNWQFQGDAITIRVTVIPQSVVSNGIYFPNEEETVEILVNMLDMNGEFLPNYPFQINIKEKLITAFCWIKLGTIMEDINIKIEPIVEFNVTPKKLNLGTIRYNEKSHQLEFENCSSLHFQYQVLTVERAYILINSKNNFNLKNENGDTIKYFVGWHEPYKQQNPTKFNLHKDNKHNMYPPIKLISHQTRKPIGIYTDTLTIQLVAE